MISRHPALKKAHRQRALSFKPSPRLAAKLAPMDTLSQEQALQRTELRKGESAKFWREPRYDSLECLSALFRTHVYEPHTHETYVIGCVVAGCERFDLAGVSYAAGPDHLCFVDPDAVHDGCPEG